MRDLIVVGGGPAGLATALYAARAGLSVLVREPRETPVDKACGEGLMPGALARLHELGVDPPGHVLHGIRYVRAGDGERPATARFRDGPGRGVRRTVLQEALWEAVHEAGIVVQARRVREVRQGVGFVEADGERFGHLVAADGLHSPIRRGLGLDAPASPGRRRRYGLRGHLHVQPWTPMVEVHWSADAEAYVTPVAQDLVGVALLTRRRGPFTDQLADFPELSARLGGCDPGPVLGAGPLRQGATARVTGRVLLVGDAAGYLDALTGEGVSLALAQADAAVRAIVSGDLTAYERAWWSLTRRYRWITEALLRTTGRPVGRRLVVPAARRLPGAFGAAVNQLARQT